MGKTIIFDIDETLYNYTICHVKAIQLLDSYCQEQFGWEADELKSLWKVIYAETMKKLGYDNANIHDTMLRIQKILEYKGINPLPHARKMHHLYWDTIIETMVPFDGVIPFLKSAKEKGFCIGIATDLTVEIQFRKLEKLKMLEMFDFIVTSEEAGCEKPHKGIFEDCCKKADALPAECWMIGDNWDRDIVGALDLGMRAAWHVPGKNREELDPEKLAKAVAFGSYYDLMEVII